MLFTPVTGGAIRHRCSQYVRILFESSPDALFVSSTDRFLKTETSDIGRVDSCCACVCEYRLGVAREVNAPIDDIGQMLDIFSLIGKVLEVYENDNIVG